MKNKKKEKKKRKLDIYKFFGIILILSSIALMAIVTYINVLPIKYLLALSAILLIINLIINFFLFRKKVKKKPKKIMTITSIILSTIFIIGSLYIFKTFAVINDMTQQYKTYTYYVLVNNEKSYENITDIEGKNLGYYKNDKNIKAALNHLDKKAKTENEDFTNLESLGTSILNNEEEAILIEESQKTKLDNSGNNQSSENPLSGFSGKTKTIYTFKIKVRIKDKNITKDVFNIYISGMDEYGKVREVSRSDVNIVLTVNPNTRQILITNIPRDYYVKLHDTTGYNDKLTHAGIYGIETSIKTIEDLLDLRIDYYFKVNFSSLQNIINALGGVEVYSEYSFQSFNGYNFTKGYNKVNGKEALAFVRERHSFEAGDNQRGKNQQAMIEAMFRKCTSPEIIVKYNSLLNSLKGSMLTNMSTKTMTSLVKMQLKENKAWTITSNSLSGTGSYDYTYTYPYQELYVTAQSEESVGEAKALIKKVANGELLESSYQEGASDVHSVTKSYVPKNNWTSQSTTTTKKDPVKKEEPKKDQTPKVDTPKKEEIKEETPTEEPPKKEEETKPVEPEPPVVNPEPPIDTPENNDAAPEEN